MKFTSDGGEVTVKARVEGNDVVITVTDTGVGICTRRPRADLPVVRAGRPWRFHARGHRCWALRYAGRIVGLMGGRMWLESEVGVGSTFAFTVPLGRQSAPDRGGPKPGARLPTILVIEDDRKSVDLLVYLESAGFDVSSAHDGPTGLAAMRRETPVAVIPRPPSAPHGRVGRSARDQDGPRHRAFPSSSCPCSTSGPRVWLSARPSTS